MLNTPFRPAKGAFIVYTVIRDEVYRQIIKKYPFEADPGQLAQGDLPLAPFKKPLRIGLFRALGGFSVSFTVPIILDPVNAAPFENASHQEWSQ
jgi:hypothetical protein